MTAADYLKPKEGLPVPLGKVVMTPGVAQAGFDPEALLFLLRRHRLGDWGEVDDEDWEANDKALQVGSRILSAYHIGDTKLWIITEADRSATTILFPSEY